MTTTDPYAGFSTKQTPQTSPAHHEIPQVVNNAGGYVFEVDALTRLRRFLTIGTTGGTYYVGEKDLTTENGQFLLEMTKSVTVSNHRIMVDEIVDISVSGRAAKQNPALFALAIACQHGSTEDKQYARAQITKVVRTGTHLFTFVGYLKQFGGWSMGLRKAVAKWYEEKDANQLAYQLIKYRQREGWTHRDVLRLVHPKIEEPKKRAAIEWAVKGVIDEKTPSLIAVHALAQHPEGNIPQILDSYKLPWEALPDSAMNDADVWDKMLDNGVPTGALLRQLPRLTKLGMLPQMGGRTDEIIAQLTNPEALAKARIHPINVLVALKTYQSGVSLRGSSVWTPTTKLIDGLDEMFYRCFDYLEPTGKRTMLSLDVSGSMGNRRSEFPLSPAEISAAMALVTAKVEPQHMIMGFSTRMGQQNTNPNYSLLKPLNISARQRMDDVLRTTAEMTFGGTDVALPMVSALENNWEIDTFVVYTDNETYHGKIHPFQALRQYRAASGINAKLVVVAATPTKFTVADPSDAGMLDISGFDSSAPQLIADFSAGKL